MSQSDGRDRPPGPPPPGFAPPAGPPQAYPPQAQPYPPQPYPPQAQPYPPQPYPPQAYPPQAQPYPPQAQPYPPQPYPPQAQPYPPQPYPPQAYPPQAQPYPPQPYPPQPGWPVAAPAAGAPRRTHLVAIVKPPSGHGPLAMALLSLKRAFRLRIDPNEVLDDERQAMLAASPPIRDETQQAFMAWRRSVLFMAALLMIPVAILHAVEHLQFDEGTPDGWKTLTVLAVIVEAGFAFFLWTQVPRWTQWQRQSRALKWGWVVSFLVPFLVFLYPLASEVDYRQMAGGDLQGLGVDADQALRAARMAVGISMGAQALVSLAPKVISLLQGLIRSSIATKTLFPGAAAPGWLMVVAAPLYSIIFYVFVLLPYHFTGSGFVVAGMLLVLAAKGSLVRAGLGLTRPMRPDAAKHATSKALSIWMSLLIAGAVCIVIGLFDLIKQAKVLTLVNFGLSMGANILVLTLIGTDTVITALGRAHGSTADEETLAAEVEGQVAAFTGANAGAAAAASAAVPPHA